LSEANFLSWKGVAMGGMTPLSFIGTLLFHVKVTRYPMSGQIICLHS
jgi:hypothetical protein